MSIITSRINPQPAQNAQLKAAGISPPATSASKTKSPNTQGVPQAVTNVNVIKRNVSTTQVQLTVTFNHNANDPYFVSGLVYLKQGNANPVQIGSGSISPITLTVAKSNMPSTIIVVSQGNWGATPVNSSPVKTVSLA